MAPEQAPFHYSIATATTLPLVSEIVEHAARWLTTRGIRQWEPGSFSLAEVVTWQVGGVSLLAWQGGVAVGTITVGYQPDPLWAALPGDAGYIYKLAVRRDAAGTGVSLGLLRAAEAHITAAGQRLARLDCWAGNVALRRLYSAAGYELAATVAEESWECALWQRALTLRSPTSSLG